MIGTTAGTRVLDKTSDQGRSDEFVGMRLF